MLSSQVCRHSRKEPAELLQTLVKVDIYTNSHKTSEMCDRCHFKYSANAAAVSEVKWLTEQTISHSYSEANTAISIHPPVRS